MAKQTTMITFLKDFESLANDKKNIFWDYVFGFVDYNTTCNKLFKIEQKQVTKDKDFKEDLQNPVPYGEVKFQLRTFIDYLEYYRNQKNSKSSQQLDLEQVPGNIPLKSWILGPMQKAAPLQWADY